MVAPSPKSEVAALRRRFAAAGDPGRAEREKAYHKSALRFHGVDAKTIGAAAAEFRRAHPQLSRAELLALVQTLWDAGWFDLRSVALDLAWRFKKLLRTDDLDLLEQLLRESKGWAHVDWISTRHVAHLLAQDGKTVVKRLRAWSKDDDFWIRRASMLALLPALRRGEGDFDLFTTFAAPMLPEREFFIRKAIGWVLREVAKKRPALTRRFVHDNLAQMSGLTLREAIKPLPEAEGKRLLARHRDR